MPIWIRLKVVLRDNPKATTNQAMGEYIAISTAWIRDVVENMPEVERVEREDYYWDWIKGGIK